MTDPPRSLCRTETRCDRCGEYPTGPRSSPSPRTGACAFGGELSARQASLAERISGTPEPTGVTTEPFYTAFRGVPHVIAATQHASINRSDCKIGIVKSDLRVYAIKIVFITKSIRIRCVYCTQLAAGTARHNRIPFNRLRYSIGGGNRTTQS